MRTISLLNALLVQAHRPRKMLSAGSQVILFKSCCKVTGLTNPAVALARFGALSDLVTLLLPLRYKILGLVVWNTIKVLIC